MYDASISSGQLVWKMDDLAVGEILKKGEVLTAMATIMYSHHKLQQVTILINGMKVLRCKFQVIEVTIVRII